MSMLVVRFYVGTKEEDAIVKTYNKLYSNFDRIPQGVSQPLIKVRSIDDVPIMALTLWGKNYDSYQLRQIAGELENQLKQIDDVSETKIIGGLPRQVRVVLDTQKLAAYGMTAGAVAAQLQQANARATAGSFAHDNQEFAGRSRTVPRQGRRPEAGCGRRARGPARCICAMWRLNIVDGPAEPQRLRSVCQRRRGAKAGRARRLSGGDHHAGQAQRHQRHHHHRGGGEEDRRSCAGICCRRI